ncbi:hypothetical protein [Novipirellula caenicola]|uniref:Uncharacterized protein n=1 Tax=Novipirellula caenicola TaxID=1536901 RepID=A0ABP9W0H9_9BACT
MNYEQVTEIADAKLYKGYMLYPCQGSAIKHTTPCRIGTLHPAGNSAGKPDWMRTQCLVVGEAPRVSIAARFLHLLNRDLFELDAPADTLPRDWPQQVTPVASIRVGETLYQTAHEAIKREIRLSTQSLQEMVGYARHDAFSFSLGMDVQSLESHGKCVAVLHRSQSSITGDIEMTCEAVAEHVFKLTVTLQNTTQWSGHPIRQREDRLDCIFVSAHLILGVEHGEFVSAINPPSKWATSAATCQNQGLWPVLVGDLPDRDWMLAAPIVLRDYPQIDSPSPSEILAEAKGDETSPQRIRTRNDHKKLKICSSAPRARSISK